MFFLGTGAAELCPNPLCGCEHCQTLMASPEYRRKRSAFLMDERHMIDFGPDVLAAALQYGVSLGSVRHVFITHAHNDHLCFDNIAALTMTKRAQGDTMVFHMSAAAHAYSEKYMEAERHLTDAYGDINRLVNEGKIAFETVHPYENLTIDGLRVRAVHSNHRSHGENEYALNYLIERGDGGKLLYVADSGLYSEENLNYLANANATELIMEGTWGALPIERESGHLNAAHFIENIENMRRFGVISDSTRIFVTHINPKHDFTHGGYQAYMDANAPQKVRVAWDGLAV